MGVRERLHPCEGRTAWTGSVGLAPPSEGRPRAPPHHCGFSRYRTGSGAGARYLAAMSAALRTATALLALLAFALPAGATAVQVLADCCERPCSEHAPEHAPDHAPAQGPDEAPAPGDVPAPDGAVCCIAPALPVSDTAVVVPSPERPVEVALLAVPVVVPQPAPPKALEVPARPPPLPAVRPHLVFSVLLI